MSIHLFVLYSFIHSVLTGTGCQVLCPAMGITVTHSSMPEHVSIHHPLSVTDGFSLLCWFFPTQPKKLPKYFSSSLASFLSPWFPSSEPSFQRVAYGFSLSFLSSHPRSPLPPPLSWDGPYRSHSIAHSESTLDWAPQVPWTALTTPFFWKPSLVSLTPLSGFL